MSKIQTVTVESVKRVGRDENYRKAAAAAVVAAAPEGYDWSEHGAVPKAILAALGLTEHPEPQKVGPKGSQKETTYGVGFRVLADAVRSLTKEKKTAEPGVFRFSLSGEGGSTITIKPGDPRYALAVEAFGILSASTGEDGGSVEGAGLTAVA